MKKDLKSIAYSGLMVALAFLFSYIELLIPLPIGIPGVKLGLANIVVFCALYLTNVKNLYIIVVVRVILASLAFGNIYYFLFSIVGGLLSATLMLLCMRKNVFGKIGISVVGGVAHNVGQILVAIFVLETPELVWYFPTLLVAGTVAGAIIGLVSALVLERISRHHKGVGKGEI